MFHMRTQEVDTRIILYQKETPSATLQTGPQWYAFLRSPLWICLLLALGLRIWLIVHTQGFIDGDEALVGIQAQHILHGELPVYYYGQPYMGSLEAYLIALLFALFDSSTWAMRAESALLSLLVVWLTWRLAGALAGQAQLSSAARRWFMTIAALFVAVPPLYDAVMELRAWGGHIETYVITLALLLSALRLTQRWHTGAGRRELLWRWAGLGFLVGLGLWVYPLIINAIIAAAIWIVGDCIVGLRQLWPASLEPQKLRYAIRPILHRLAPGIVALPASLVGFAPALVWGARHHWANIRYLLSPNNTNSLLPLPHQLYPNRLAILKGTALMYGKCIAPHIIGGALPSTPLSHSLLQASIGILVIFATLTLLVLSFFRPAPALLRIQRLAMLPSLFAITTAVIFCSAGISRAGLFDPCTRDGVGRYAAPLLLALPFFFATFLTCLYLYKRESNERQAQKSSEMSNSGQAEVAPARSQSRSLPWIQTALIAFVVIYLGAQSYTYARVDAGYPFQSFACAFAPVHNEPIIAYMQQQHIKYAWGTIWIGNAITFKTQGTIIVADPRIVTAHAANHIPAYTAAVQHADRPSILAFAEHNDAHPDWLKVLDGEGVTYRLARFPAEQGLDVLVVTPDRTLSPYDGHTLGSWAYRC